MLPSNIPMRMIFIIRIFFFVKNMQEEAIDMHAIKVSLSLFQFLLVIT